MSLVYETVYRCDLCGNPETKLIDDKGNIVQCKRCGLRFVNPRCTQEEIFKICDFQHWRYPDDPGWRKIKPEQWRVYRKKLDFVEKFIQNGKILDVGAGLGGFLSLIKDTGKWQCFGTDTSEYAAKFTKDKIGIELSLGQVEDLKYPQESFDAITFWHVLEHLPYPSQAIKEVNRILKDNGFLFIAVPNDSWLARRHFFKNAIRRTINRLPIKKKLKLKKMYPGIEEGGHKHLFHFTSRTLTKLLKKYNLRVKKYSVDYDYLEGNPKIKRWYKFCLLFCHVTRVNLSRSILIAAQKEAKEKKRIFPGNRLKQINKINGHLGLNEGRLLFEVAKSLKNNSVIVEIGAYKGKSTCFIAAGIGSKNCQFFTIDTWQSDKMPQGEEDAFADFLKNTGAYKDKIKALRGYSYNLIKDWPEERKIDFLWIDGDHSYEGAKRDIQDWIPLVKKNSPICFHDYRDAPGVKAAVDEAVSDGLIRFIKTEGCIYMAKRS